MVMAAIAVRINILLPHFVDKKGEIWTFTDTGHEIILLLQFITGNDNLAGCEIKFLAHFTESEGWLAKF